MEDESKQFIVEIIYLIGLIVCIATLPWIGWFAAFYLAKWLGLGFEYTRILCLSMGLAISAALLAWVIHGFGNGNGNGNGKK